MIGLPEILIVVVLALIFFGYKRLPALGRAAGEGLRSGYDKVRGVSSSVGERVEDKVDPTAIGRSAGRGAREVRELREALTGKEADSSKRKPKG